MIPFCARAADHGYFFMNIGVIPIHRGVEKHSSKRYYEKERLLSLPQHLPIPIVTHILEPRLKQLGELLDG